jgi:hypothetical protein
MTKKEFIQEWKEYGKTLINEEDPTNRIQDKDWERFGRTMYNLKTKLYPNDLLEHQTPNGTECRQYPRAFQVLSSPFGFGVYVGELWENLAELK